MNVSKFVFCSVIILMLLASGVFAQVTHMGVPAKDMVVLKAFCASFESNPTCLPLIPASTSGSTYDRILADGSVEQDFQMPLRKVLVITDWEWRYSEETVMEDSVNDPVTIHIGSPLYDASFSESSLKVTAGDSPLSTQGHASGATQMTSGYVVAKLPMWFINRAVVPPLDPPLSQRSFQIILRGYLLDVP